MDRKTAGIFTLELALTGCGVQTHAPAEQFQAIDVTSSPWGRGFCLADQNGRTRSLADFKGRAVALYFGYTHCPGVCPTTLAKLTWVRRKLGNDQDRLQVLFVTVDPQRDTPAVLKRYASAFDPTFLGLRGDDAATARTARDFKVYFEHHPQQGTHHLSAMAGGDRVAHASGVHVFDPLGRLRLYMDEGMLPDAMAHDIRRLLKS